MPTTQTQHDPQHVLQQMLQAHPQKSAMDQSVLLECVTACLECAATCTSCADACLGEQSIQSLVRCIRLNLDCATVCRATGTVLTRQTAPERAVIQAQLRACIEACHACGQECERHAGHHEHCRVCAESCRRCEAACEQLTRAA